MDVHNARGNVNVMKVWANYLFPILHDAREEVQFPISNNDIIRMMVSSGHKDVVLDEDDGIYEKGDRFKNFHRQANHPMSRKAFLPASYRSG